MQYYNIENTEYLMQQIVNKEHKRRYLQNISERNGVKFACDETRVLAILPKCVAEWDLSNVYFDTDEFENSKFEFNGLFNHRADDGLSFNLSKEQAALLLVSFDGTKTDHKRKYVSLPAADKNNKTQDAFVGINMDTMEIMTEDMVMEIKKQSERPIMGFNIQFIEDAFKFVMCSDANSIEVYYNGNASALILKSGRLYALVLPVKPRD